MSAEDEWCVTPDEAEKIKETLDFLSKSQQYVMLFGDLKDGESVDELERKYTEQWIRHRAIPKFEQNGYIQRQGDEIQLSPLGSFMLKIFEPAAEVAPVVQTLNDFVPTVESPSDLPPIEHLEDVEVHKANSVNEALVRNRYDTLVSESDTLRELVPRITGPYNSLLTALENGEIDAEFVHTSNVHQVVKNNYTERAVEHLQKSTKYYLYEGDIPYTLSIFDERVSIFTRNSDNFDVLLEGDDPELREWAIERYNSVKGDSAEITVEDGDLTT